MIGFDRKGVTGVAEDNRLVLVAAYQDDRLAQEEFDALVELVKAKAVRTDGAILVAKDADGTVRLSDTGDHLGRKGAGWGGGVGVVVGLFAPPMLASVVVGAAAGAVVGKFADHKLKSGLEDKLGAALAVGSAAVIAVMPQSSRLAAEQALPGSPAKSVVEMDGSSLSDLKASLAQAMGKFSPDRTVLPIPDRAFGGTAGRTLRDSVADWTMIPGPRAPEGAPNVLVVLIDDAGFGAIDTYGGPISSPNFTRVQQMGVTYNRFHVTAVCSPTRAALLTGRNQHRVGFGSIAEYPGPFPGLHGRQATQLRRVPADPEGERLRHRRVRQVAPDPGQRAGCRRPVRPLADVVGVRPLVGLPVRRGRPVRPDHHAGQLHPRGARG